MRLKIFSESFASKSMIAIYSEKHHRPALNGNVYASIQLAWHFRTSHCVWQRPHTTDPRAHFSFRYICLPLVARVQLREAVSCSCCLLLCTGLSFIPLSHRISMKVYSLPYTLHEIMCFNLHFLFVNARAYSIFRR